MKRNSLIYSYPFAVDIVVAVLLFVGRHSLASRGFDENVVGSILLFYGIGYCVSSLFMRRIVRVRQARWQMTGALAAVVLACCWLANSQQVRVIQVLFCVLPFAISLFFNAFQAFMLDISTDSAKPLAATAGHYTFSWSLGYALGPFVSGGARFVYSWEQIYYLAAFIAGGVGLLVLWFRPVRDAVRSAAVAVKQDTHAISRKSLVGPAWVGLVVAWVGWNVISTYWPVQAARMDFPASVKGGVEFAQAITQALSALCLVYLGAWHHRPHWLLLLGVCGLGGACVFAGAVTPLFFICGAVLYGIYTSSAFSNMVYHSMFEADKAVKRVSLNETFVGLSFLIGPVVARLLHGEGEGFTGAYGRLAGLLAAGIVVQAVWAQLLLKRDAGMT